MISVLTLVGMSEWFAARDRRSACVLSAPALRCHARPRRILMPRRSNSSPHRCNDPCGHRGQARRRICPCYAMRGHSDIGQTLSIFSALLSLLSYCFAVLLFDFRRIVKAPFSRNPFGHRVPSTAAGGLRGWIFQGKQRLPAKQASSATSLGCARPTLLAPCGLHADAMVLEASYPDIVLLTPIASSPSRHAPGPLSSSRSRRPVRTADAPILGVAPRDPAADRPDGGHRASGCCFLAA